MAKAFTVSEWFPASPEEIYRAWLDSQGHSKMTGSPARVGSKVGEEFEAWDGYIHGKNLELEPGKRILQSWRTEEFDPSEQDSLLEIVFEPAKMGPKSPSTTRTCRLMDLNTSKDGSTATSSR